MSTCSIVNKETKEPIKYYYLEESVSDYLETLYVTTFTRYVLKSL